MLTNKPGSPPPVADYVGAADLGLLSLSRNVLADFLASSLIGLDPQRARPFEPEIMTGVVIRRIASLGSPGSDEWPALD